MVHLVFMDSKSLPLLEVIINILYVYKITVKFYQNDDHNIDDILYLP